MEENKGGCTYFLKGVGAVRTERVPMFELKPGDIVWNHGMRIRISGGKQHEPRERYNDTISWFHGDIINDFHPYGWAERTWTVQSADWVYWQREIGVAGSLGYPQGWDKVGTDHD